jgi:hypothetical protein
MPPLSNPLTDCRSADGGICLGDFYFVLGENRFIYVPTHKMCPPEDINGTLPPVTLNSKQNGKWVTLKPAVWLKQYRRVQQLIWAPGLPEIVEDRLLFNGGWRKHTRARVFNLYQPPTMIPGDATLATPWREHLRLIYPEDAEHITNWFAHRVQHPAEKIHALVMGGGFGIGKDWLLQALKMAVGSWNFEDVRPADLTSVYNPHVKSVVLRVNEAHDLGDSGRFDRYAFYECTKVLTATPPDAIGCADKYIRRFYVLNVCGMVITTNHKTDGIYLEPGDRRHYVAWSDYEKEWFVEEHWPKHWHWLEHEGGAEHVAAYLLQRNLSKFDSHAPPPLTNAFYEIISASRAPEDAELVDALDELGQPRICSVTAIARTKCAAALEWLLERKSRRSIPHRLERCGYVFCRNPNAKDGRWKVNRRWQTLYAKTTLSLEQRSRAVRDFILQEEKVAGNG